MGIVSKLKIGGGLLLVGIALLTIGYLKYENHILQSDLKYVNQQLGAANQREIELTQTNADQDKTITQLKKTETQARKATAIIEQARHYWHQQALTATAQIKKDLADENCADQPVPGITHWVYYDTDKNRISHAKQDSITQAPSQLFNGSRSTISPAASHLW